MKLRIISDLHIDPRWSLPFDLPVHGGDSESILIIAGDAGEQTKACEAISGYCDRFLEVIYVMGNHEYYHGSMVRTVDKIKAAVGKRNLRVLDGQEFVTENLVIIGATLWTDMFGGDPFLEWNSRRAMNDYHVIRTGSKEDPYKRRLQPVDTMAIHRQHLDFIKMRVAYWKDNYPDKKIVVVTHHAPSAQSVATRFIGNSLNCNFHSNLDEYLMDQPISLWVHGHMHNRSDYMIGDCRVVCNARGYHANDGQCEWTDFDPHFTIDLFNGQ